MDGLREEVELDHRPYRGRLGTLVRQANDGPMPLGERAEISDKLAKSWFFMQRAKSGRLMLGVMENMDAERVLWRGRRLFDVASRDNSALPSSYVTGEDGEALYSDDRTGSRIDHSVAELDGKIAEQQDAPFQMDFRHRFGPPRAPRERRLASMTEAEYKRALRRMPDLHEERRTVPRGPDEKRPPKVWQKSWLNWAGKTKPKAGPPPFNPLHDTTEQHEALAALMELECLRGLMGYQSYQVFTAMLANGVTTADVGSETGEFRGKQAEAVGLDRSRTAIRKATEAFEIIDVMEANDGSGWLHSVCPNALVPVWLLKRLLRSNNAQ